MFWLNCKLHKDTNIVLFLSVLQPIFLAPRRGIWSIKVNKYWTKEQAGQRALSHASSSLWKTFRNLSCYTPVAISSSILLAESSLWHSPSHRPWPKRCFCNLLFFYCFISQIKWLTIFPPDFFTCSIKYLAHVRQYTQANRKWLTSTLELESESGAKERLGDQSCTLRDESGEPAGLGKQVSLKEKMKDTGMLKESKGQTT